MMQIKTHLVGGRWTPDTFLGIVHQVYTPSAR